MYQTKEERIFQEIQKKVKDYSIYDEMEKNTIDKNIIKKISILYEIFNHINKINMDKGICNDFIYTEDIKNALKYDDFVRIRFHIIPLVRKKKNSFHENDFNYIDNINNAVSNIYDPNIYNNFLNKINENEEKLKLMLKKINEIECAYIYKYRSDNKIKLTFDIFCHNFYIFLSYDYKKHLCYQNLNNKYNKIEIENEFKLPVGKNILQLNSLGLVLTNNGNSFEEETLQKLNPFLFESTNMINEFHAKKDFIRKNIQLDNDFFIKHSNYEDNMRKLLHFEQIKDEYKRLKKSIKHINLYD